MAGTCPLINLIGAKQIILKAKMFCTEIAYNTLSFLLARNNIHVSKIIGVSTHYTFIFKYVNTIKMMDVFASKGHHYSGIVS